MQAHYTHLLSFRKPYAAYVRAFSLIIGQKTLF